MTDMTRLPAEIDRLYGPGRALVLELVQPADGRALLAAWAGVQTELDLPAPAIAVSGSDALQLWFSTAVPVGPSAGQRFLQGLHARFLPEVPPAQLRLSAEEADRPASPCAEVGPERWSAFVTHDLASLFAETPWLDLPPNLEGQAAMLAALRPIRKADFDAALARLGGVDAGAAALATPSTSTRSPTPAAAEPSTADPPRFLASVMNDEAAPLALRVEAARILLQHGSRG